MELNWSTFVLEIINFLVLIWILKRFFYQPVLTAIARRRASVEKSLADAKTLHDNAEELQSRYQHRLADWEQERQRARAKLAQEIEEERNKKMNELQSQLEQKEQLAQIAEARRQSESVREAEQTALIHAGRFASRLLDQLAGPELQTKLVDMLIHQLPMLSAERIATLRNSCDQTSAPIIVTSAFPISDGQRKRLQETLEATLGPGLTPDFQEDTRLLAGVRITLGACVLGANLLDELNSFVEFAGEAACP